MLTRSLNAARSAQPGAAESTGDIVVVHRLTWSRADSGGVDFLRFERRPEVGAVIIPERSGSFFASCRVLEKSPVRGRRGMWKPPAFRRRGSTPAAGMRRRRLWRTGILPTAPRFRRHRRPHDSLIWHDEGRIQLHVTPQQEAVLRNGGSPSTSAGIQKAAHNLARSGVLEASRHTGLHPVKASSGATSVLRRPVFCAECGCNDLCGRCTSSLSSRARGDKWGLSPKRPSGCRASTSDHHAAHDGTDVFAGVTEPGGGLRPFRWVDAKR